MREGAVVGLTLAAALVAAPGSRAARGEATVLQNGVSPTPAWAGCTDTWISDEQWERNHNNARGGTLRTGGKRRILIQFDLSSIPKGHAIHQAVLRLANAGYPRRGTDGRLDPALRCYRLTRSWSDTANWLEHTRTDYKAKDEGDWTVQGGDLDEETDFGGPERGVAAEDTLVGGSWGHMHELDVTAVVRDWHEGTLPNHGLAIIQRPGAGRPEIASSEWYVPAYRPKLIVAHGPKASAITRIEPLTTAPKEVTLDPLAATPDTGKPRGDYHALRVGQNPNCALRGISTDAYIKEAVERFPGTWGWMNMSRVGGRAGDVSRALLYFDLREIPTNASIKQATLRLTLVGETSRQVANYRYGAFLLRLPEAPGWSAEAVTAEQEKGVGSRFRPQEKTSDLTRKENDSRPLFPVPWPEGGLMGASSGQPVALGAVVTQEITDSSGRKRRVPGYLDFDLTGVVRAWAQGKAPNCGIVLDNRIEGGAYDFYSSRSFRPDRRPYLEITLSPASLKTVPAPPRLIDRRPIKPLPTPALPPGDYWVEPMRRVHARFKGKPGTLAQYGDSITVTMAFLANFSWQRTIAPKNCPGEVQREMDVVTAYANRQLWRDWKEAQWGNTGMMMSDWLLTNIDTWQKKMNPEVSVILFGSNDLGRIHPPDYTENMAASIRRMLADGTVPMLTTVPPCARGSVYDYWLAHLSIAHEFKIPVIDFYAEIMRRRPEDWNGRLEKFKDYKGYQVPTLICRDGVHPSNPKEYVNDFSEEALNASGFSLRNYMTLRKYHEVITKVLKPQSRE